MDGDEADDLAGTEPPVFLRAAGHPLRWRLLAELANSDRQVHELTALLGRPQNLISYHLGLLRKARLVAGRRSAADGRDTYYRLDLAGCGRLLAAAGGTLHPALRLNPPSVPTATITARRASQPLRVLFLCTGNSARSPMAEALLRRRAEAIWSDTAPSRMLRVCSAGSRPKPVHPSAVAATAEYGIDLSSARSKPLEQFTGQRFDYVITLCDRVREVCPEFGDPAEAIHWSIPDPAAEPDGFPAYKRAAADLSERIEFLLHRIAARTPTPESNTRHSHSN